MLYQGLFFLKLLRSFGPRHCDIANCPAVCINNVVDATLKVRPSAGIGPKGVDLGFVRLNAMLLYTSKIKHCSLYDDCTDWGICLITQLLHSHMRQTPSSMCTRHSL